MAWRCAPQLAAISNGSLAAASLGGSAAALGVSARKSEIENQAWRKRAEKIISKYEETEKKPEEVMKSLKREASARLRRRRDLAKKIGISAAWLMALGKCRGGSESGSAYRRVPWLVGIGNVSGGSSLVLHGWRSDREAAL
jgi:hypothetical protein